VLRIHRTGSAHFTAFPAFALQVAGAGVQSTRSSAAVAAWHAEYAWRAPAGPIGRSNDVIAQAAKLVVSTHFGSVSMLQRKLHITIADATWLMDRLHELGVVGGPEGIKARDVLVPVGDLPELLRRLEGRR
jgi:DNA segregation ATPase FtsK/SpoIIIE, S-DNA-T family